MPSAGNTESVISGAMIRTASPAEPPFPWSRLVWPLAVAEITLWAGLYYLFPALLPYWEAELGWTKAEISGAYTAGLAATALGAPFVGRLVDRGHGRLAMALSAICGAALVVSLTAAEHLWQFYAAWIGLGLCMAGCLYEATFAVVTRLLGAEAKRAITVITLVGGLAGTVAFPTGFALAETFGWRVAAYAFAGAVLFLAAPLVMFAGRGLKPANDADPSPTDKAQPVQPTHSPFRKPAFWCLALAFGCIALTHGMVLTHMLPLLADRGLGAEAAALAASMIGPMQVAGRLAMMSAERVVSTIAVAVLSFAGMAVGVTMLLGAAAVPILVVGFVVIHGAAYGVTSITRPVVTAELMGRRNYGAIAGGLAVPFMGAIAAAPTVSALVWAWGGYDRVLIVALMSCAVGACALLGAIRSARR